MRLVRGLDGHPSHPPLTDATIGAYTVGAVLAVLNVVGLLGGAAARGWWLATVVALVVTVPTALTGVADWLSITAGTPLRRTATSHLLAMVAASLVFLAAALTGHDGYRHGVIGTLPFGLTLVGYAGLTLGGWLGGAIVFVHGMRVEGKPDAPALDAALPFHESR